MDQQLAVRCRLRDDSGDHRLRRGRRSREAPRVRGVHDRHLRGHLPGRRGRHLGRRLPRRERARVHRLRGRDDRPRRRRHRRPHGGVHARTAYGPLREGRLHERHSRPLDDVRGARHPHPGVRLVRLQRRHDRDRLLGHGVRRTRARRLRRGRSRRPDDDARHGRRRGRCGARFDVPHEEGRHPVRRQRRTRRAGRRHRDREPGPWWGAILVALVCGLPRSCSSSSRTR